MRKLAADIGMSEVNLHRCVNNNKIQASDLEKIAGLLGVEIGAFFTGEVAQAPVRQRGTQNMTTINQSGGTNSQNATRSDDVDALWRQIEEKDRQIARLLDIIQATGK